MLENRSNNSIPAATPLPLFEDPAGSGFLTSSIAVGAIDPGGDSDYWSFPAQQGDQLIIDWRRPRAALRPRFIVYNAAGQTLSTATLGARFGSPAQDHQRGLHHPGHRHLLRAGCWTDEPATQPGSYQFRLDLGRGVQLEPYDLNFANNSHQRRQ